ncbi:3-oxo-5-alpha-steroid 4-dehydrogenase 1 [Tetrabaena socialis]|uniref:Steroid 5-alpha-reductase DET2 n=1 Tax=Tetrabaena socialis TaxID=47790 RepID=A0A2J8AJQ0_9CHLO|nr:3-oxo-5-alpha-steroid 4-dehydrogenase 1 [Tetrabaena socialis]|eukprot:PNH12744.1 3-oxo-5-alpha-steroid 4-dehydrogenase 1 [Tetrabaena socialis]
MEASVRTLMGDAGVEAALQAWHWWLSVAMLGMALPVFVALMAGISAPYGRYSRLGWGVFLPARIAWLTQELPSPLIFVGLLIWSGLSGFAEHPLSARSILALAFCAHYAYRAFVFPFIIRGGKPTPLTVWALSFIFCIWNGFLQGWSFARQVPPDMPWSPRVVVGLCVWLLGWLNVMRADSILIHLRKPGETGYKIPRGGMFQLVSAGNYASEIMEWSGFALAAGTLPAAAFAVFTFCNLAPRGHHHHKWYREKFREQYPRSRRAVVPFLW